MWIFLTQAEIAKVVTVPGRRAFVAILRERRVGLQRPSTRG